MERTTEPRRKADSADPPALKRDRSSGCTATGSARRRRSPRRERSRFRSPCRSFREPRRNRECPRAASVHVFEAGAQIIPAGDQRQHRRRPQAGKAHIVDPGPDLQRSGKQKRAQRNRSAEHTSELQSLKRISYDVFCLKNKQKTKKQ